MTTTEAWRDVPVDSLADHGLSPSILRALQAAGLDTLGKLDTEKSNGTQRAMGCVLGRQRPPPIFDICGIGRAQSRKINNALGAYCEAHPEPAR